MKLGNITCEKMDCVNCPYIQKKYLKICTSFKIKEELFKGLKRAKRFSKEDFEKLENYLNQEVEGE